MGGNLRWNSGFSVREVEFDFGSRLRPSVLQQVESSGVVQDRNLAHVCEELKDEEFAPQF